MFTVFFPQKARNLRCVFHRNIRQSSPCVSKGHHGIFTAFFTMTSRDVHFAMHKCIPRSKSCCSQEHHAIFMCFSQGHHTILPLFFTRTECNLRRVFHRKNARSCPCFSQGHHVMFTLFCTSASRDPNCVFHRNIMQSSRRVFTRTSHDVHFVLHKRVPRSKLRCAQECHTIFKFSSQGPHDLHRNIMQSSRRVFHKDIT